MSQIQNHDLSLLKIDGRVKHGAALGRRKRRWPLLLVLLLLAGLGMAGAFFYPFKSEVMLTTVALVHPAQPLTLLNASGYVVADRKSALASKTTGRLVWRGVEEGSKVTAGQIVARLESEDVSAVLERVRAELESKRRVVEQCEADFNDADANHKRLQALVRKGVIARSEYDSAFARQLRTRATLEAARHGVISAKAQIKEAEVALEYTLIRAPFDAVVLTKNADIGDIITPLGAAANAKASVVTIADMASLLVECDVSETNIAKVKPGAACDIQLDSLPDAHFPGRVHMIVPTADRTKATVMVKVAFEKLDPRALPEMSAKVAILERALGAEENRPRLCIDPKAVLGAAGQHTVFVVQDGKAAAKPVTLRGEFAGLREIASGLVAGDKVILAPPVKLKPGDPVTVVER